MIYEDYRIDATLIRDGIATFVAIIIIIFTIWIWG